MTQCWEPTTITCYSQLNTTTVLALLRSNVSKEQTASASLLTINLMLAETLYKLSYKISINRLSVKLSSFCIIQSAIHCDTLRTIKLIK